MHGITGRCRSRAAGALLALAVVAAGCAGGSTAAAPEDAARGTTASGATTPGGSQAPAGTQDPAGCNRPTAATPDASAVPGSSSDHDITSFDGTTLRAHWFPRAQASDDAPSPTVLMGPGWGLPGDTDVGTVGVFGAINIATLREAGFNVLTWDPRGFGASTGTATVNSADHEGRDVGVLLDWVAAQPGVQLDRPGDARVGMVGGSYGGGIQLVAAAIDCRVDALVPIVAWHSLRSSLFKADTPKTGWSGILIQVAGTESVDPHTVSANTAAQERGVIDPDDVAWFEARGPAELVEQVRVPTLFVHGTVDTLFTLDEAVTNYRVLRDNGVEAGMLWFCGGHGTCLTEAGDLAAVGNASIAWLRRHVAGDATADTGARVNLIDQRGVRYPFDDYPVPTGTPIAARGSGTLALLAEGGSGPASAPGGSADDLIRPLALPITPAPAANAVEVSVPTPGEPALVVGAPQLELTYSGTAPPGERPTRVFAQLVDDATGLVVGNQITPIEIVLDGRQHTASVPLEVVVFATTPGSGLTLQVVATTVAYATPRLGGQVELADVVVTLPVAAGITPAAG